MWWLRGVSGPTGMNCQGLSRKHARETVAGARERAAGDHEDSEERISENMSLCLREYT